jgi:hypothetical protein
MPSTSGSSSTTTMYVLIMCSDWHYGEVVRMPGINTYDKAVAKKRIQFGKVRSVDEPLRK